MFAEHTVHDGVHLGADPDGLHDLDPLAFHQVTRDDYLADESRPQSLVLRLDDHDPFARDQFPLYERRPEDDIPSARKHLRPAFSP